MIFPKFHHLFHFIGHHFSKGLSLKRPPFKDLGLSFTTDPCY